MKTIIKNTSTESIKFDCLNDIPMVISFLGADWYEFDGNRLFAYTPDIGYTYVKLGQYLVKIIGKRLILTEEEFESL